MNERLGWVDKEGRQVSKETISKSKVEIIQIWTKELPMKPEKEIDWRHWLSMHSEERGVNNEWGFLHTGLRYDEK